MDDLVGQMYRSLDSARKLEADPAVQARIDDLVAYTRYVELYKAYDAMKRAKSPRQKEFDDLALYVFRIRASGMVHGAALIQDLPEFDNEVKISPQADIHHPPKDAWLTTAMPLNSDEIAKLLADGIAANPVLSFRAVPFSRDLVPAAKALGLTPVPAGNVDLHGAVEWFTWLPASRPILTVSGAGGGGGPAAVQFKLYAIELEKGEVCVAQTTITSSFDKIKQTGEKTAEMTSPRGGLHRVETDSGWKLCQLPAEGVGCAVSSTMQFNTPCDLYFYVPQGTKVVAGATSWPRGRMLDDTGGVVYDFQKLKPEIDRKKGAAYFAVPVEPGHDGKLWKMEGLMSCMLYTVPPYYTPSAEELLLPAEVVKRDAMK